MKLVIKYGVILNECSTAEALFERILEEISKVIANPKKNNVFKIYFFITYQPKLDPDRVFDNTSSQLLKGPLTIVHFVIAPI